MSNRIVLLVTMEDTGEQTSPLDPPTVDAVQAEIQANLESVWPYTSVSIVNMASDIETHETYVPMCSICRTRGRHKHACE